MIANANTSFAGLETSAIASSPSQSTAGSTDGLSVETVTQAIANYTSWLFQSGKSSLTVRRAEQLLTAIVWEVMGVDFVHELDLDVTIQFLEHQQDQGYAGKTIRTQLSELKRFSKWLVRSGRIQSDPIAKVTFEVDESESADRVQVRFQRLFKMIEVVSNSRLGVTYKELGEACSEVSPICERTVKRDVVLLISIGVFRKERDYRLGRIMIKLNPLSRLSQLARRKN